MNKTEERKLRRRLQAAEDLLRETVEDMYSKIEARRTSLDDMCEVHGDLADRMDELGIIHAVELREAQEALREGPGDPENPEVVHAEEIAIAMAHYHRQKEGVRDER